MKLGTIESKASSGRNLQISQKMDMADRALLGFIDQLHYGKFIIFAEDKLMDLITDDFEILNLVKMLKL